MEHLLNRYEATSDAAHMEHHDSQRVTDANVPYLLTYLQRDEAGHMDPNATINALCAAIRTAEEYAADEIRAMAADRDAIADVAAQYQAENQRLRERVTNAETMLRSIREGWDRSSTGMARLGLDLILGNPEVERRNAA